MTRSTSSPHRLLIALLAALVLVLTACGGGGSDDSETGDSSNPWVLGFQISLADGGSGEATVSVEATGINGDIRYDPLMMDWVIGPDDTPHLLFSDHMEAGEVEIDVEGAAVEVAAVWGRSANPSDPLSTEIEVREVISTTTVDAGTTATVTFP